MHYRGKLIYFSTMNPSQTKLTSQGQVSVPASVRRALGLAPGSSLEWVEQRGRIVVQRATRHDSQAVHDVLFPQHVAEPKSLDALKDGIRKHMHKRHARD